MSHICVTYSGSFSYIQEPNQLTHNPTHDTFTLFPCLTSWENAHMVFEHSPPSLQIHEWAALSHPTHGCVWIRISQLAEKFGLKKEHLPLNSHSTPPGTALFQYIQTHKKSLVENFASRQFEATILTEDEVNKETYIQLFHKLIELRERDQKISKERSKNYIHLIYDKTVLLTPKKRALVFINKIGKGACKVVHETFSFFENRKFAVLQSRILSNNLAAAASNEAFFLGLFQGLPAFPKNYETFYGTKLGVSSQFLVQGLYDQGNLTQFMKNVLPRLNGKECDTWKYTIAYNVLLALETLHSKGILYRDLKPENVLINFETMEVSLCDLGLCCLDSDENSKQKSVGTKSCHPPEFFKLVYDDDSSGISTASDCFTFGLLLHELLRGEASLYVYKTNLRYPGRASILNDRNFALWLKDLPPPAAHPLDPLIELYLRMKPTDRATATQGLDQLEKIMSENVIYNELRAQLRSGRDTTSEIQISRGNFTLDINTYRPYHDQASNGDFCSCTIL